MNRRRWNPTILAAALLLIPSLAAPAAGGPRGVRLVQKPIEDAAGMERARAEGFFRYQDYAGFTSFVFGTFDAWKATDELEVGLSAAFESRNPDEAGLSGVSGLRDADLYARYDLVDRPLETVGEVLFSTGLLLNLPVGDEDLFEGTFDVEAFGAGRYVLERVTLTGHFGVRFNSDYEIRISHPYAGSGIVTVNGQPSVLLGAGLLVPVTAAATATGELDLETARYDGGDADVRLTPGVDVRAGRNLHLRGGLALGLSDTAPDFELILGLAADLP